MAPPTPGQNTGPNDWWFLQPSDYNAPSEKWNGSYDDMVKLLDKMSTGGLDAADSNYKEAYRLLNDSIEAIATAGYNISQVWRGDAANNMQESLKRLHATCYNLAEAASMLQNNLFYNTSDDIKWGKQNKPEKQTPSGMASFGAGAADVVTDIASPAKLIFGGGSAISDSMNKEYDDANNKAARQFLNIDGGQLGHGVFGNYVAVPDKVHTDLPAPKSNITAPTKPQKPVRPGGTPPTPGGPGGPGSVPHPSTNIPHPTSPTHPTPPPPYTPPHTPVHVLPPTPTRHGTDLAGMPTGPGGGGLGPGLGGGGGLGPGLGGGGGLGPGLGGPGAGGLGGGMPSGALGAAGEAAAAEEAAAARNAALAGKGGMNGGMPMGMGGGGGGQKEERERSTWLTEDEDVWGGDGDVAPPVIG